MRSFLLSTAALALFASTPTLAQDAAAVKTEPKKLDSKFSAEQQDEINDMIQDFLMKNPEVIMKSVNDYQVRMSKEAEEKGNAKIKDYQDFLYKNPASPEIGNPKGDVTIVEFFDYNCGYCKQALPAIQKIVEEDKNVRVVFKELAVLGPSSDMAALWALAAHKQGKYWEYHQALMTTPMQKTPENLEKIAVDLKLDVEQMKKDVEDPATEAIIKKNAEVSGEMGIRGTPAFIINDQITRGYVDVSVLKTIIADKRKAKQ